MPELPEVETIKNELAPHITGRTLTDFTFLWEGIVKEPSLEKFRSRLTGQKVLALNRYGKYLAATMSNGVFLFFHMKMSGSLITGHNSSEAPKYTRAIIHLDNRTFVFFNDPRKFGRMWLAEDNRSVLDKLGPEPLEDEFTPLVLAELLKKRVAPIKALLLDQSLIAGIGNMYADEALFAARIHPLRTGKSLNPGEVKKLHTVIRQVLTRAIDRKGASIINYFRPSGDIGSAHEEFNVAHGQGKHCPNCGTPIKRITVRNRGSYFCPKCQMES